MARWIGGLLVIAACGDNTLPRRDASMLPPLDPGACTPVLGEPAFALERVITGLEKPVFAGSPPNDPRLFVVEQGGRARITVDGVLLERPFLDIGDDIMRASEAGLLTIAFHPRYTENGVFYITYTRPGNILVLEEWFVDPSDPDRADPSTRREVLVIPQPKSTHFGGRAAFGPDGYLYIGKGDGEGISPNLDDPEMTPQNPGKLRGKFLRIDVDRRDPGLEYAIPADNPFLDTPNAAGEVIAMGVRNPWGFSIDSATGHIFFGDVSFNRFEEINVIPRDAPVAERNYGWPIMTGNECLQDGCDPSGFHTPLVQNLWQVGGTCATVGGQVYRGCKMPGHGGRFFYTDFCATTIRSFRWSALEPDSVLVAEHPEISQAATQISAIGTDGLGELLLLDYAAGQIFRIVPAEL